MTDDSKPAAPSEREWTIRAYREEPCNALHAIPENHTDDLRWGDEVWVVEKARLTAAEAERDALRADWDRFPFWMAAMNAPCSFFGGITPLEYIKKHGAKGLREYIGFEMRCNGKLSPLLEVVETLFRERDEQCQRADTWQRMAEELGYMLAKLLKRAEDIYNGRETEWPQETLLKEANKALADYATFKKGKG